MRSFLGLCNVYQRFVPNLPRISNPLNAKLWKGEAQKWGELNEDETKAFETLKEKLLNPPILTLPRIGRRYTIYTDACNVQIGCVLLIDQEDENSTIMPIGYWSWSLSQAEQGYHTTERECLAVVWAVLLLRPYLEGADFTI